MTLSYDMAGDGPALVLLHSGVCDRRMWDPQWPALLDAGYQVVRCDFRGSVSPRWRTARTATPRMSWICR
ncbi:alpha/beta fold hydrolase [Streptosporangium sandarakinum]|uniref:alpha/beta fold hydrolase n=1 Tax=Streptosporangium sandarakinum TaxID=1260955 RepID=UPI0033AC795F